MIIAFHLLKLTAKNASYIIYKWRILKWIYLFENRRLNIFKMLVDIEKAQNSFVCIKESRDSKAWLLQREGPHILSPCREWNFGSMTFPVCRARRMCPSLYGRETS